MQTPGRIRLHELCQKTNTRLWIYGRCAPRTGGLAVDNDKAVIHRAHLRPQPPQPSLLLKKSYKNQETREETAEWSDTVGTAEIVMGFGCVGWDGTRRSGRHIAQRVHTDARWLVDSAALFGVGHGWKRCFCGVRQRLALSTVAANEEPTSGLDRERCLGSWRAS